MNVLNAIAQFERDLLIERTQSDLRRTDKALRKKQKQEVLEDLFTGMSGSAIARKYATSRQTIMRVRDEGLPLRRNDASLKSLMKTHLKTSEARIVRSSSFCNMYSP